MSSGRSFARSLSLVSLIVLIALAIQSRALAQQEPRGPAVSMQEAAKKIGPVLVKLTERSSLSGAADVAKRMGVASIADYDLAKEQFTIVIPKTPADDGKYGVMVSVLFIGYGYPPPAWLPTLEKYHVIWISAQNTGDNRETVQRVGLMLDAAESVRKNFNVDDRRVYASIGSARTPACGVALEYPDVFQGAVYTLDVGWFEKIPASQPKGALWPAINFARPAPAMLKLDQTRSRFYIAARDPKPPEPPHTYAKDAVHNGFERLNFRHVKLEMVPEEKMGHWVQYAGDYFENAMQFLDAPLSDPKEAAAMAGAAPARQTAAKPAPAPTAAPAASAPEDKNTAAARQLSLAKSYIIAGSNAAARTRLQKVLESYPGTPAAAEAKSLLAQLDGK